jgi:predicted nucleotidyltransferase
MLDVLFSNTRREILKLFFTHPDREYHLREVARSTGAGRGAVARELKVLSEAGILALERKANLSIYRANRECPVFEEIHGLVIKTSGIADVLKCALYDLEGVSLAFIFGSVSRGELDNSSDVDVCIVGSVQYSDVSRVLNTAERILDRKVSPVVYTTDEFHQKVSQKNRFITSVMAGSVIMLIGREDELGSMGSKQPG